MKPFLLFHFLRYVQPWWYFNLTRNDESILWHRVPDSVKSQYSEACQPDSRYHSQNAIEADIAYRAIQRGYIMQGETGSALESVTDLRDNYCFVKKYFGTIWVMYTFFLRVFSLKNPVSELKAVLATWSIPRESLYEPVISREPDHSLSGTPRISVIIPTLNRYSYLGDVLEDLVRQNYPDFEVLVADQSQPFRNDFYNNFRNKLDIKIIRQEEPALWQARNTCVLESDSDYLLFFDDDSRVDPDWIQAHIQCIQQYNADVSSGVSISTVGDKVPPNYSFFRISDQLDTGNAMVRKSVFAKTGLFDTNFERMRGGDGEFGLRVYLNGFINISNPEARRVHLKASSGGLREMSAWDSFRSGKWLDPKPIPSITYMLRKYYGTSLSKYAILKGVLPSLVAYRFKGSKLARLLGVVVGLLLSPLLLYTTRKSWKQSNTLLGVNGIDPYHE